MKDDPKTRQYRFLPESMARLDRCIRYRGESRDKVLIRILTESSNLPAIKRATKNAEKSYEEWKRSEAMKERMMRNFEYLIQCCKSLIRDVEDR